MLTGDRGAGGSAEIALRPLRAAVVAASKAYCFVDGGAIDLLGRGSTATRRYSLAPAGAGCVRATATRPRSGSKARG